jgi:hypothetical protein
MGVDFNWIGTTISSGSSHNGFGKIVSFPSVPAGFPAAGSYNSTLTDVTYPIVNGGASVEVDTVAYPSQFCDVTVKNDGSGGTYTDWGTATDIQYFDGGTIVTITQTQSPVEMPAPYEGNYYDSEVQTLIFYHDGAGGASDNAASFGYFADGTIVTNNHDEAHQIEVPEGSENYYPNGKYDTWQWDGSGNIEELYNIGSFFANGTLITDVNQTVDVPADSGSYYDNGKYTRYNWNGSGGVTTLTNQGSFYANNTTIRTVDLATEVPAESGNTYPNNLFTIYKWNGYGGYTETSGGSHFPNGTYIFDDGTDAWYWDGYGGYYSESL